MTLWRSVFITSFIGKISLSAPYLLRQDSEPLQNALLVADVSIIPRSTILTVKEFARIVANSRGMIPSRFSLIFWMVFAGVLSSGIGAQTPNAAPKSAPQTLPATTPNAQRPAPPNTKSAPKPTAAVPARWMWIWRTLTAKSPETVFFRAKFRLGKAPTSARLLISADDNFTVWFNERKEVAATGNDWTSVQEFDVTRQLKAGDNLMAIECRNTEGPGGLIYKLIVTLPGNVTRTFVSDAKVKVNNRVPPVWNTLAFDDSACYENRRARPRAGRRDGHP